MTILIPGKQSALDLEIKGTAGEFQVQGAGQFSSVKVKYLLTHVGFKIDGTQDQKLLEEIVPVREIFDLKLLSFDEIVQRDIDDSRVSSKLIPYLLESSKRDLVKLFPPIVAVAVPLKDSSRSPSDFYGADLSEKVEDISGHNFLKTTIGNLGKESFQFKQLMIDGLPDDFNYASLSLNTKNTKLVVVDGQHRAMALLALYRNLTAWPDKTMMFQKYYTRWSPQQISQFDLSNVKMPVLICTFPELSENSNQHNISVTAACRSIFLALNKNAKPVSRSKNILLDDRDLISEFLRTFLNEIKSIDSTKELLNLANFELDSTENKVKIQSPLALSSVMHVYSFLEKLFLTDELPRVLSGGSKNLWKVKHLENALSSKRLDGLNNLGMNICQEINRINYSDHSKAVLNKNFEDKYVPILKRFFSEFYPYKCFESAVVDLRNKLNADGRVDLISLLFDNQGGLETFKNYVSELKEEHNELKNNGASEGFIKHYEDFQGMNNMLDKYLDDLDILKARYLFNAGKKEVSKALVSKCAELFSNTFNSNAFQNALICTFFFKLEETFNEDHFDQVTISKYFDEYINSVNNFFESDKDWEVSKKLIKVFVGTYSGSFNSDNMKFDNNSNCFRNIIVSGELNPGEWYRFRAFFLELWTTENQLLQNSIHSEVEEMRFSLLKNFHDRRIQEYCDLNNKIIERITDNQKTKLIDESKSYFSQAISALESSHPLSFEKFDKLNLAN